MPQPPAPAQLPPAPHGCCWLTGLRCEHSKQGKARTGFPDLIIFFRRTPHQVFEAVFVRRHLLPTHSTVQFDNTEPRHDQAVNLKDDSPQHADDSSPHVPLRASSL